MLKTRDKIHTWDSLEKELAEWKKGGKIVFTNGCFDILHIGHVDYLEKARALGSCLIVGMNTDESVQRIKGPERPIINENSRMQVLASLFFVDAVILFNEETPLQLIKKIKPDILVKGDDYTIERIVGADFVMENGGEVKTIPLVKGFSTSNIVNKIKNTK